MAFAIVTGGTTGARDGTAVSEGTTLTAEAASGQAVIVVASAAGISASDTLYILDTATEIVTVLSVDGNNVTLTANLTATHASGTVVSERTNPLAFTTSAWVDVHIRGTVTTEETSDPTLTIPAGFEVSFDGGTTVYDSTDSPLDVATALGTDIGPVNIPMKIRQPATLSKAQYALGASGSFGAGSAPTLSGTLTATAGVGQIVLGGAITASDNVGVVKWQYRIKVSGGSYGSYTDIASSAYGTFASISEANRTISGLDPFVTYIVQVVAVDAAGNASSGSNEPSAVPVGTMSQFDEPFTGTVGTAPNATYFGTVVENGSGTASAALNGSGQLRLLSSGDSSAAAAAYLLESPTFDGWDVKTKAKIATLSGSVGYPVFLSLMHKSGAPAVDSSSNILGMTLIQVRYDVANTNLSIIYYDNANAIQRWDTATSAYVSSGQTDLDLALDTYINIYLETTATQWRLVVKDAADSSTLLTTSWVSWSATRTATNDLWLYQGDLSNNITLADVLVDSFKVYY
jgi:hypothetical protein